MSNKLSTGTIISRTNDDGDTFDIRAEDVQFDIPPLGDETATPRDGKNFIQGLKDAGEVTFSAMWVPREPQPPLIYVSEFCMVERQVRFPRTRKRRMLKKWARDKRNFAREPGCVRVSPYGEREFIIVHSIVLEQFCRTISSGLQMHIEKLIVGGVPKL